MSVPEYSRAHWVDDVQRCVHCLELNNLSSSHIMIILSRLVDILISITRLPDVFVLTRVRFASDPFRLLFLTPQQVTLARVRVTGSA